MAQTKWPALSTNWMSLRRLIPTDASSDQSRDCAKLIDAASIAAGDGLCVAARSQGSKVTSRTPLSVTKTGSFTTPHDPAVALDDFVDRGHQRARPRNEPAALERAVLYAVIIGRCAAAELA